MSQENIAIVRRFEDSFARRDLDRALECVDTDFEFDWSESMGPFVGIYRGHDGLTRFWTELLEAWEFFEPRTIEVIDCGSDDVLITLDLVRARGKGSGIEMEARGAMFWTLREGKIVRVKMFQTRAEALEAAGLTDQFSA
jgi:ketosteroid isomerase-like protein